MLLENTKVINKNESKDSKAFVFWLSLAGLIIVLDQLSKFLVFKFLEKKASFIFLGIQKFENYNFAFSLNVPKSLMFLIYAIVLIAIVHYIVKHYKNFNIYSKVSWTLIVAGAVSNIAERIALGYVRDFIVVFNGIFNLADFYIILGILVLLLEARSKNQELRNTKA